MTRARMLAIAALGLLVLAPTADAQPAAGPARLGVLLSGTPQGGILAFRDALAGLGWVEGRNLQIVSRIREGGVEGLAPLAAELVAARVQVILAANTYAVRAAKQATSTIPIVGIGALEGLVASLGRPEGNVTGLVTIPSESSGKHVDLLKEAVPAISRVAYFTEAMPGSPAVAERAAAIGRSLQIAVHPFGVSRPDELDAAFRVALERRVDAVAVVDSPFMASQRARLVDFVTKHRLPSASLFAAFPESGFLMSYGTSIPALYRRAAHYVDRILRGARPADLPVELPTKFDLVVTLRTAKALGLTVPQSLLVRADRVVE